MHARRVLRAQAMALTSRPRRDACSSRLAVASLEGHGNSSRRYGALMARILTIVVAIAAVVGAAIYVKSSKHDDAPSTARGPAKNALTLPVVVPREKEALLKPLAAQFNAAQTDAKPVFVRLRA